MKIEKFKVLLYLKKSGLDKNGKAPIMGRITVNRTMAQFSCKLSCTPSLWNPRASRLDVGGAFLNKSLITVHFHAGRHAFPSGWQGSFPPSASGPRSAQAAALRAAALQ